MKPRDFAVEARMFGKSRDIQWKADFPTSSLIAAEAQHRCALEMRQAIKEKYGSIKEYCEETSQGYQHITQVLRGASAMSADDIGHAVASLEISVSFSNTVEERTNASEALAANSSLRDALGAYYTPLDVASYMVQVLGIQANWKVLEPSFGDGSFLSALKDIGVPASNIMGCEIDPVACSLAVSKGLLAQEGGLFDKSFFDLPICPAYDCVIGNPPYVRLRAMETEESNQLRRIAEDIQGTKIGEESSEWLPFLIKATSHLKNYGNIGFVLPFDFTYVKYARATWAYLSKLFSRIEVVRIRERVFDGILQDVVLFFAFYKSGNTDCVQYRCYESKADLINDCPSVNSEISISAIVRGDRVFQEALVNSDLLSILKDSKEILPAGSEAQFHIGYVCGNKDFFHPSEETVKEFCIPEKSLIRSAVSSRQLGSSGVNTSTEKCGQWLWIPRDKPTVSEQDYIAYGESQRVHEGYKCRVRKPWWKVPGVAIPDLIMSVFGESPRLMINDANWAISNSLLGVFLNTGITGASFCASWYTPLTLLSVELEIHSLGGGVLIAVPREASRILKLSSAFGGAQDLAEIDNCLRSKRVDDAYSYGAKQVSTVLGNEALDMILTSLARIRRWRNR